MNRKQTASELLELATDILATEVESIGDEKNESEEHEPDE